MNPENSNGIQEASNERMKSLEPPYKPSWIDLFNRWVEELPVNVWVFHLFFGIMLILIQLLFLWVDDGLHAGELLPIIIFNGLATPFLLALIYQLDKQALAALNSMHPALEVTAPEFRDYQYKLSTMPLLAPLVAGLVLMISTILTPLVAVSPVRYAALEQMPVFSVVFHIIDKSSAFLFGVVLYHIIRQLRMVNFINSNHVRVNLFHLGPLQAFSRLTASTAIAMLVFVYTWMLINPELLADPVLIGYVTIFSLIAISIFVWPLWGVHKVIDSEKNKALHEISLRFEAVLSKFNQSMDDEDYAATDKLHGTISSLEIQHKRIRAVSTWPWRSETARLGLTAIALPLMLMIIQYFILQALG